MDKLQAAFESKGQEIQEAGQPFVKTIRALSGVVESCFGVDIRPGFEGKIEEFKAAHLALGISVTPKVLFQEKIFGKNSFQF